MTPPSTPVSSNKPTFDSLKADAQKLGADAGKGNDSYSGMLIKLLEGSYHGAIDLAAHRHGHGIDDTMVIVGEYNKARGNTSMFKGKNPAERKALSNGRKMVKGGQLTKFGNGQPLANVSDLMYRRNKLFSTDAKNTDDAANSLLKYMTAQLKSDTLIEGEDLHQFCRKNTAPTRTDKALIKSCIKTLKRITNSSPELKSGIENLGKAVNAITLAETAAKTQQAA